MEGLGDILPFRLMRLGKHPSADDFFESGKRHTCRASNRGWRSPGRQLCQEGFELTLTGVDCSGLRVSLKGLQPIRVPFGQCNA